MVQKLRRGGDREHYLLQREHYLLQREAFGIIELQMVHPSGLNECLMPNVHSITDLWNETLYDSSRFGHEPRVHAME